MSAPVSQTMRKRSSRPPPHSPGTPHRRTAKSATRLQGTNPAKLSYLEIAAQLIAFLALAFTPAFRQVYLISRILRGFDSIFLAGTGYGRGLILEGLTVLGGKKKAVIVVCPLKALERDQIAQARKKGINAITINADNSRTANLWKQARTKAQLVYMSLEMANSESFIKLWKDQNFALG